MLLRLLKLVRIFLFITAVVIAFSWWMADEAGRKAMQNDFQLVVQGKKPAVATLSEHTVGKLTEVTSILSVDTGGKGRYNESFEADDCSRLASSAPAYQVYKAVNEKGNTVFTDNAEAINGKVNNITTDYRDMMKTFDIQVTKALDVDRHFIEVIENEARKLYQIASPVIVGKNLRPLNVNVKIYTQKMDFIRYRNERAPTSRAPMGFHWLPTSEIVLLLEGGNEQQTLGVFRHELAHVLLHQLYGAVPVWLEEGLAEFFQHMDIQENQVKTIIPAAYVEKAMAAPSLKDFMGKEGAAFYAADPKTQYAMAWALVYYLMTDPRGQQGLAKLLDQIAQHPCQHQNLVSPDQFYAGGITALEQDLQAWISQVQQPVVY